MGRFSLPASADTVAAYIGATFLRGTVKPSILQSYLSPINTRQAVDGLARPALGPFLASVRAGYHRRWYEAVGALPPERAKFPAAAARQIALAAARSTCPHARSRLTTITTSFLFFRRTAELLRLTLGDVRVLPDGGVAFQVTRYKNAERRPGARRLSYVVPPDSDGAELPVAIVRDRVAWLAASGAAPLQPLFSPLGVLTPPSGDAMGRWLTAACAELGITAPAGAFFAPYSTRGGAATAAYAVGVPEDRIVAFFGHNRRDTVTAHTHYIDAFADPCPAACLFFDRFLPRKRPR